MGLFDILKGNNDSGEEKNIGELTSKKATEIIKDLSGGQVNFKKKLIDNVVVITNASGGTGASTVTSNVAYQASKEGLRVIVIDLNILFPIQHMYFGIKQEIEKPDLLGYLIGKDKMGDIIENSGGISLIYANNRGLMDSINSESDQAVNNLSEAIAKLRQLYDLVLIDTPMQISNNLCNLVFFVADQIYTVWDEGIASIANTEKIRRNMASSGIDTYTKMKCILNKRTGIQYNEYPFKKLNIELVATLPFEQDIIYSSLRSELFCRSGSSSSKNAGIFCERIAELTNSILTAGGYIK